MGLDYTELGKLLNDKQLAERKDYHKSGKEYLKRLSKIFENADIPDPELKSLLDDLKRYSEIDAVATSSVSKDGIGSISEERKLFNKIISGFNKYYDFLNEQNISPDDEYIENGESKSYKDAFTIVSNVLQYFETLQTGSLKDDLVEQEMLKKDPKAKTKGYFIDARGKSFESASQVDLEKDISDVPLFSHDPSPSDIRQYNIGDCYLLAGLSELALRDPQAIKDSMRDNKDGTVTVRFWQRIENDSAPDAKDSYRPVYVTVDKKTPRLGASQDCCWTQIMERAYVASGLHMSKGMDVKYNKPMPHNINEMYEKYKNMDPEERPTHQECPWLFDKNGKLHKPKLSYKSIEGGLPGPFLAAFLGEKAEYREIKPERYFAPKMEYQEALEKMLRELGKEYGIDIDAIGVKNKDWQNIRAKLEYKLLNGKDADLSKILDNNGNAITDEALGIPYGSILDAIYNVMSELDSETMNESVNFAKLFSDYDTKLKDQKSLYGDILNQQGKDAFDTIGRFFRDKLEDVKDVCCGRPYTGVYSDAAKQFYNKVDELTREKGYLVTAGTYGESDSNITAGIYDSHAYSILGVKEAALGGKNLKFVEVRNPHGKTGRKYVAGPDNQIKKQLDENCKDGVFLVELDDFILEYEEIHYNSPVTEYSHVEKDKVITAQIASKLNRIGMNLRSEIEATDSRFSDDSEAYKAFKRSVLKFEEVSGRCCGYGLDSIDSYISDMNGKASDYKRHLILKSYPDYDNMNPKPTEPVLSRLSSRQKERYKIVNAVAELNQLKAHGKSKDPRAELMNKTTEKYAKAFLESKAKDPKEKNKKGYQALLGKFDAEPEVKQSVCAEFKNSGAFKTMFKNIGFTKLQQMYAMPAEKIVPAFKKIVDKNMQKRLDTASAGLEPKAENLIAK